MPSYSSSQPPVYNGSGQYRYSSSSRGGHHHHPEIPDNPLEEIGNAIGSWAEGVGSWAQGVAREWQQQHQQSERRG